VSDENTIDISGLDEFEVIAALHNGTQPLGLGMLHARPPMTAADVRAELTDDMRRSGAFSFDYYHGRPLKVRVGNGQISGVRLYDRDAGDGACADIVAGLREAKK